MDADKIYREALQKFREQNEKREIEQQEQRQKVEAELLGSASNMEEFIERRNALRRKVMQPDIPLDEMSMSDYLKVRNKRSR